MARRMNNSTIGNTDDANTASQDMVSAPFLRPWKNSIPLVCTKPTRRLPLAIPQDDRIKDLAALHATPGNEVKRTATAIQKIQTWLGHHETPAARTVGPVGDVRPTLGRCLFQIFDWKTCCLGHGAFLPSRGRSESCS